MINLKTYKSVITAVTRFLMVSSDSYSIEMDRSSGADSSPNTAAFKESARPS